MQQYAKYFRAEQKVQLRLVNSVAGSTEALTLYFAEHGPDYFDLVLPYKHREGEELPLPRGGVMELATESMGIGVKMDVEFVDYLQEKEIIRVKGSSDLKVFQRRAQPRIDMLCGIRFTRGQGTLRSLREHWLKNIEILNQTRLEDLPPFTQSHVNLSASGLRMAVTPPVQPSDLFLVLLQLSVETKPLCLLCETVWTGDAYDTEGRIPCGMHFLGMRDADRKAVEERVKRTISH